MDLQLTDKLALVTGSTAGIGMAIAKLAVGIAKNLASEGASVVVNGRSQESVEEAIRSLSETKGKVMGLAADLSSAEGVQKAIAQYPQVDILVNNLGIFEVKSFVEITDEDWQKFFNVNVMSGVRLSRAYLPKMLARNWGRIIFISSESGIQIPQEMIHYGMTKAAQIAMRPRADVRRKGTRIKTAIARGLAESTANTAITVNAVLPVPTRTKGVEDYIQQMAKEKDVGTEEIEKEFFAEDRPTSIIQRFIEPEEIANLVAYVASPLASATNGAALQVEGGVLKSAF